MTCGDESMARPRYLVFGEITQDSTIGPMPFKVIQGKNFWYKWKFYNATWLLLIYLTSYTVSIMVDYWELQKKVGIWSGFGGKYDKNR